MELIQAFVLTLTGWFREQRTPALVADWRSFREQQAANFHYELRMCAARFGGSLNGFADEASGGGGGAACPLTASRVAECGEAVLRFLHSMEMGTIMTVFYHKKSLRPERRTFQILQDTRQIVWSRTPDKVEGESK